MSHWVARVQDDARAAINARVQTTSDGPLRQPLLEMVELNDYLDNWAIGDGSDLR